MMIWECMYTSSGGSDGKKSAHNVGDPGSIPGSGRSSHMVLVEPSCQCGDKRDM